MKLIILTLQKVNLLLKKLQEETTVDMEIPLMGTNLRFFGDTLENICDTQMCRDTQFENH